MPIQFRSRIAAQQNVPTIADGGGNGWCCGFGADYTKAKCIALGGFFLPNESNGTNCKTSGSCSENNIIAPIQGACCYWDKQNDFYVQGCTTVNNQAECILLNKGSAEGLQYGFYPGETCLYQGGNIKCNPVRATAEDLLNGCNVDDTSDCYDPNNKLGTCCVLNLDFSTTCTQTIKTDCAGGFWSPPYYGKLQTCEKYGCNGIYFNKNQKISTAYAYKTKLDTTQDVLEKLPQPGSLYQGGLYVGIFRPGTPKNPIGSTVYGNPECGPVSGNYIARGTGPSLTTEEKAWILIADIKDYGIYSYESKFDILVSDKLLPKNQTSFFDGYFNTYFSIEMINDLKYSITQEYKSNGFDDWYIPSQDELAFYFKTFSYGYSADNFNPLTHSLYMSSSLFYTNTNNSTQSFNEDNFLIAQINDVNNYGKTVVVNKKTPIGVRLFRRIYLEEDPTIVFIDQQPADCVQCLADAASKRDRAIAEVQKEWVKFLYEITTGKDVNGNPIPEYMGGYSGLFVRTLNELITLLNNAWPPEVADIIGQPSFIAQILGYLGLGSAVGTGGLIVMSAEGPKQYEFLRNIGTLYELDGWNVFPGARQEMSEFMEEMVRLGYAVKRFNYPGSPLPPLPPVPQYLIVETHFEEVLRRAKLKFPGPKTPFWTFIQNTKVNASSTFKNGVRYYQEGLQNILDELLYLRIGGWRNLGTLGYYTELFLTLKEWTIKLAGLRRFLVGLLTGLLKSIASGFLIEILALLLLLWADYEARLGDLNRVVEAKLHQLYGDPDCCDKATGKCKKGTIVVKPRGAPIVNPPIIKDCGSDDSKCLGQIGGIEKQYRAEVEACCTTICNETDDQGNPKAKPAICSNLPKQDCRARRNGPLPPSWILKGPPSKPYYPAIYDKDGYPIFYDREGNPIRKVDPGNIREDQDVQVPGRVPRGITLQ